jgi:virginiamycin A acetyltransferase
VLCHGPDHARQKLKGNKLSNLEDNRSPDCLYPLKFGEDVSKNHVFLKNIITNPNIIVGDYTFYHDFADPHGFEKYNAAYFPSSMPEKLIIGKYCSIASGAQFISSVANHHMDGFSTYPFAVLWGAEATGYEYYYPKKGDVIIGNDVWIGTEATILPGVTIGDGAIIGAKSIVTKNVAPYSIVAGNPATQIRLRFCQEIINTLLEIQWWNWPNDIIIKNASIIVGNDIEKLLVISASLGA